VNGHPEFFSTTAQVIPVILLIVAFEIRQKGGVFREANSVGAAFLFCFLYLTLFAAEAASLHVLASNAESGAWRWFVGVATALGGAGALFLLLQRDSSRLRTGDAADFLVERPWQAFVAVVAIAAATLGLFLALR
jgi:hypothetical protein